jgi:hypothetical protein
MNAFFPPRGLMAFTGGALAQTVDQYQLNRIEQTVNRIVARTGKYSGPALYSPISGKPPSPAEFTSAPCRILVKYSELFDIMRLMRPRNVAAI